MRTYLDINCRALFPHAALPRPRPISPPIPGKPKRALAEPLEVNKDKLGPRRQELFDQTHSYALPGRSTSSRLLLLSCGGAFDNATGHYESNIFVYALPT